MTAPTEPTAAPAAPAQPTPTPPAPAVPPAAPAVPTPTQVFPPQQPTAPAPAPAPSGTDPGFPADTPLAQMTVEQRENYWRHQARKHENAVKARADYDELKAKAAKLDELQAANQTELQRAVAEAEQRGRAAALADAGGRLAASALRTSLTLTGRLNPDQVEALLAPLDAKAFLTADGLGVDADKVLAYVSVVAPTPAAPANIPAAPATPPAAPAATAPQQRPDMGQGTRTPAPSSGLEAGRALARQRFGTANTSASAH